MEDKDVAKEIAKRLNKVILEELYKDWKSADYNVIIEILNDEECIKIVNVNSKWDFSSENMIHLCCKNGHD